MNTRNAPRVVRSKNKIQYVAKAFCVHLWEMHSKNTEKLLIFSGGYYRIILQAFSWSMKIARLQSNLTVEEQY